jgi:hypothetical protein
VTQIAETCALPKLLQACQAVSLTCRTAGGNAGRKFAWGRKNLPERAPIAGYANRLDGKKARFYWIFRNGMAFAEELA